MPSLLLCLLLALPLHAANRQPGQCPHLLPQSPPTDRLVIIIDDLGYREDAGLAAIALPGKLNFAVLPFTPFGQELATLAHRRGKEVLLHAPMSTVDNKPLGRGGLTPGQSEAEFQEVLAQALADIPHARGVNNHMGSDLTRRRPQMQWLMQVLASRELYFVDSRTDKGTVAAQAAREARLPHLSRQVFLDNDRDPAAIAERFERLVALARERGLAVGIGHPYPETLEFLARTLPQLRHRGLQLALVSEVVNINAPGEPQFN